MDAVRLEEQLSTLAEFGFTLEPGVGIDDFLDTFDRDAYEAEPYDLLFFTLGIEIESEPWGRRFCRRLWNFDTECIGQTGDYVRIVDELSHVAGKVGVLQSVCDHVDLESGTGWLTYRVDGIECHWDVTIDDDWADPKVIAHVMRDLQQDGGRFYAKDNGQAAILCFLSDDQAARLNQLSRGAWSPTIPNIARPASEITTPPKRGMLSAIRHWLRG
jgi:hypothetical protein